MKFLYVLFDAHVLILILYNKVDWSEIKQNYILFNFNTIEVDIYAYSFF
jgi:hypothetical protein